MDALRTAVEHAEDAGRIYNLAEKALTQAPNDAFALHCKAIALLQTSGANAHKVAAALVCFDKLKTMVDSGTLSDKTIGTSLGIRDVSTLVFQHAYALYRQGDYTAAVSALQQTRGKYIVEGSHFAANNLLAQSLYNTERFEEAAKVYEAVLEEAGEDDYDHIITNLTACYAAMGDVRKCEGTVRRADQKLFEHLLNCATAAVEKGDADAAKSLLDKAEVLLRRDADANGATLVSIAALEGTTADAISACATEREYADEYALILVERAYIAQRFDGDGEMAERLLALVTGLRIGPQTTQVIAAANLSTLRSETFYDTYRTLKQVQAPAVFSRLNRRQRRVVQFNTALLLLQTGKVGESRRIAERLTAEHGDWGAVPLLLAAILLHNRRVAGANAEAELLKGLSADDNAASKLFRQLAVAQVRVRAGNVTGAVEALAGADVSAHASVVATLCDLHMACGQYVEAAQLLGAQKALPERLAAKVVELAEKLARCGRSADALALLKATGADSNAANAVRVMATAGNGDVAQAEAIAAKLDVAAAVVSSSSEADADTVDGITARLPSRADTEAAGFVASSSAKEDTRKSGNRHRPMRHPCKNLKPDAKIDYERWLPLSIRTYYKDLPERRKKEMRRLRREEQAVKRKQAERRKAEAAAAAVANASQQ